MSTTLGNPGNAGNLLEFNWSWRFVIDGVTTKHPVIKISSIQVVWKVVMMMTYICDGGYVYLVNRITDVIDSVAAQ